MVTTQGLAGSRIYDTRQSGGDVDGLPTTLGLGQRGELLAFYSFTGDTCVGGRGNEAPVLTFRQWGLVTGREEEGGNGWEMRGMGDGEDKEGEQLKRRGKHLAKMCGDKNR